MSSTAKILTFLKANGKMVLITASIALFLIIISGADVVLEYSSKDSHFKLEIRH